MNKIKYIVVFAVFFGANFGWANSCRKNFQLSHTYLVESSKGDIEVRIKRSYENKETQIEFSSPQNEAYVFSLSNQLPIKIFRTANRYFLITTTGYIYDLSKLVELKLNNSSQKPLLESTKRIPYEEISEMLLVENIMYQVAEFQNAIYIFRLGLATKSETTDSQLFQISWINFSRYVDGNSVVEGRDLFFDSKQSSLRLGEGNIGFSITKNREDQLFVSVQLDLPGTPSGIFESHNIPVSELVKPSKWKSFFKINGIVVNEDFREQN